LEPVPLADEAIGPLAGLDQGGVDGAGQRVALERFALAGDEGVFHSGLHPEPNHIVGGHASLPENSSAEWRLLLREGGGEIDRTEAEVGGVTEDHLREPRTPEVQSERAAAGAAE